MRRPEELAALRVDASDIFRRRLFLERAGVAGTGGVTRDHDDVADHEWARAVVEAPRERLVIFEAETRAAVAAESGDRFAGLRVERVEVFAANGEDSLVGVAGAALPEVHTAGRRSAGFLARSRKELLFPHGLAGLAVE